jgi:peptide/nickel transport system permease protein
MRPLLGHPLGTDELGRDLWSRLIYGARVVLVILPVTEDLWIPGGTAMWGVLAALFAGHPWACSADTRAAGSTRS